MHPTDRDPDDHSPPKYLLPTGSPAQGNLVATNNSPAPCAHTVFFIEEDEIWN